jgi:hypothetical protein
MDFEELLVSLSFSLYFMFESLKALKSFSRSWSFEKLSKHLRALKAFEVFECFEKLQSI